MEQSKTGPDCCRDDIRIGAADQLDAFLSARTAEGNPPAKFACRCVGRCEHAALAYGHDDTRIEGENGKARDRLDLAAFFHAATGLIVVAHGAHLYAPIERPCLSSVR